MNPNHIHSKSSTRLNTEPLKITDSNPLTSESKNESKDVVVKKFPYQKKVVEEFKEENIKENTKKKKKKQNKYNVEDDNLAADYSQPQKQSNQSKKRKISDRSDKYTKKKFSHNDIGEYDFTEVLVR